MIHKLKENLPTIEILLGFCIYLYFVFQNTLYISILFLIFFIYMWLFTTIILNKYNLNIFINILSFSGILVSVTLFFMYGVEEIPYPEGAIIFHIEAIAKSFLLFFFSSMPLIIINKKTSTSVVVSDSKDSTTREEYDHEKWEEATLEDIHSGGFETI